MNQVFDLPAAARLARARDGDQRAFGQLVELHHPRVWRFLLRRVGNRHDADELTQETFLAAWQRLPGFRGEAQFTTWLLGIALNLARNHHNRRQAQRREVELPDEAALDAALGAGGDPLGQLQLRGTLAALERAIAGLPEEMREALRLVRFDGLSLEQAGVVLGTPVGTIKSRLARGRDRLSDEMSEYLS